MERYNISGANGFIGSKLVERIQKDNYFSRLDRTGVNIPEFDYLIDVAAYGNLHYQQDNEEIYNANVMRLLRLLNTTRSMDYKGMVTVSTSAVTLPHKTFYSASKRASEDLVQLFARDFDKPIVVVRPYSITGVGEQKEHLIPKLIDSCLNGTQMDFVPDPVHDFLDVEDFCTAIQTILPYASQYRGLIFPVGSGTQTSNQEVKKLVEEITGKKAKVKIVTNMRPHDHKEWRADITNIRLLGWEPKYTLRETIERMVEYERKTA